jgi:dihydroneopterin aldolase
VLRVGNFTSLFKTSIARQILAQFSLAEEVFLSIRKLHPPVSQLRGSVGVSFTLTRKDQ